MYRIAYFTLLLCVAWGCSPSATNKNANQKISVVATTGMVADLVTNIGGDSIEVSALMGPGVDPHLYKTTQGDLAKLQKADIIFYNGLHLEGKMGEVFEKLGKVKKVIPVTRDIPPQALLKDPVYEDAADPHIWFNVALWSQTINTVLAALTKLDPENQPYYQQNAQIYREQLVELDSWVRKEISKIPIKQRIMITAHDAFSYFGAAYEMEVRGLQGISTLSEFGLKDRVDLVNYIVEKKIKAVFVETSVSEKNINAIIEGARNKGQAVKIGGNLFSDAMGNPETPEGNYIGMIRHNVNTIVESLK